MGGRGVRAAWDAGCRRQKGPCRRSREPTKRFPCHVRRHIRAKDHPLNRLDYGHTGSVQDVEVQSDGQTLRVWTRSGEDIEIELWGARRKRGLMERTLGRRLEFRPLGPAGRNGHARVATNGRAAA